MRTEQMVFEDLADLCSSPGYVHAIAYLCFRDHMIQYSGEMKPEDMMHVFSEDRLIRTEISTLIGLMLKTDIDYHLPATDVMQQYLNRTEALLIEMHDAMTGSFMMTWDSKGLSDGGINPFARGAALREPIFYGPESAYSFQYRDLSVRKYAKDDDWLRANRGFSIQVARDVVYAVGRIQDEKSIAVLDAMQRTPPDRWTFLPVYTFTAQEIVEKTGSDAAIVNRVLEAFTVLAGERNDKFTALNDFNIVNATPLLRAEDDMYTLFDIYSLAEALYEAPFYWMGADKDYVNMAMRHRGRFTEGFVAERLAVVFGRDGVYSNIDIFGPRKTKMAEIDVLVLFGNRAIVIQAKSKRLTIEARKGNDRQLRDDFRKSIQDSCDQAYKCARLLEDGSYTLIDAESREVIVSVPPKRVYVLCVISDHYPALNVQARQFLRFEPTSTISPPFVLDVFTLDAMTEMLDTPLRLLSYVDRRTRYDNRLIASHELMILSHHLKQNLWLDDKHDVIVLDDAVSAELDVAMLVRRENVAGRRTPDGILTRFAETTLGRLLKEIEAQPNPATIDLGYMLLTLSEETVHSVSKGIDILAVLARGDRRNHDLTIGLKRGDTGLTVHCSDDPIEISGPRLERHCHMRKYAERANSWFGVCVRPVDTSLRFGVCLDYEWERSEEMEVATQDLAKPGKLPDFLKVPSAKGQKVGRNELCPCGSGKKYKKCCLLR